MATAFERLAKKRGVDLPAERARAAAQAKAGKTIGGLTPSSRKGIAAARGAGRGPTSGRARTVTMTPAQLAAEKEKSRKQIQKDIFAKQAAFAEKARGAGGFQNVIKVFQAPFQSSVRVRADTDNRVFNTAAEYIANSPYSAALMIMGGGGLALTTRGIKLTATQIAARARGAETARKAIAAAKAGSYARNTATAKQTIGLLSGIMAQMKKPIFVLGAVGAMIGTYPWAEWAAGEALEIMGFTTNRAIQSGDPELMRETQATTAEILDPAMWAQIGRLIPFANIAVGFNKKSKALVTQAAVNDKLIEDEIIKIETGETEDERWARVREEQAAQDKAAVDYYNEQRKLQLLWEERAADRDMREDARFWARERERQRQLEAADRQAIADFWNAYRKAKWQFENDNRPSNLNFGLL